MQNNLINNYLINSEVSENFERILTDHFDGYDSIAYRDLFCFIHGEFPTLAEKTINWKINQLKSIGTLFHVSRGIYSLKKRHEYLPMLSPNLKRIFKTVKKAFPYLNFCVWDSRWFNEFMIHQLFKYQIVIETEKDATESVFNMLFDLKKKVFLNPDKEIFKHYIGFDYEVIIVKPLISESPLIEFEKIMVPSIEKLLIDPLVDIDLFCSQQSELDYIYQTVFKRYHVNVNRMKRYARRRDQLHNFEKRLGRIVH